MKTTLISFAAGCLLVTFVADASAEVCADGVRRARCEVPAPGVDVRKPVPVAEVPHGEVVVDPAKEVVVKPGRDVMVTPAKEVEVAPAGCRMVDGRRVCR